MRRLCEHLANKTLSLPAPHAIPTLLTSIGVALWRIARVLFCAFCEDRGLLPAESLKHAFEHRDPYNPRPVWLNFRGLFRAIDGGNAGLNIPACNGGLFAPDPALDALQVSDEVCVHFKDLGDYDYRPAREVAEGDENTEVRSVIDVDILGHIFEQSITDLERLRESLSSAGFQPAVSPTSSRQGDGGRAACGLETRDTAGWKPALQVEAGKVGRRRKQEGAVYTPAFITRHIVGQALINRNFEVFTVTDFLAAITQHISDPASRWSATTAGTTTRCAASAGGVRPGAAPKNPLLSARHAPGGLRAARRTRSPQTT